jgi:hypothetical protein
VSIAREVNVSLPACSTIAARIFGWQWPWFTAEQAERQSR